MYDENDDLNEKKYDRDSNLFDPCSPEPITPSTSAFPASSDEYRSTFASKKDCHQKDRISTALPVNSKNYIE